MKYVTKSLLFIALCCITLVLSSYTVYAHNSWNIRGYNGYNYYGQTWNYRQGDNYRNYRRGYRDYYYNNKKDYGIYRRFKRYAPRYRYRPYRYRRYGCR